MNRKYIPKEYEIMCKEFHWEIPAKYNIAIDVCDRYANDPDKLAMIWEDYTGEVKRYTFLDMKNLSNKFANILREIGIKRGDRVSILLPRLPETAAIFLGIYKIGAILISLSTLYGIEGIEHRIRDSGSKVVVTDSENRDKLENLKERVESLENIIVLDKEKRVIREDINFYEAMEKASAYLRVEDTDADDPAQIYYTSGTTGLAKGILHAHRYLLAHNEFEFCHDVQDYELFWSTGEWAWIAGIVPGLLGPWRYGVTVFAYNAKGKFDPEKSLYLIEKYGIGNMFTTPTALRMMMQVKNIRERFNTKLRIVCSAGEPLNPEVIKWFEEEFDIPVFDYYGLTESYPLCGNYPTMKIKPGSMGRPLPGWEVKILDEEYNDVPTGEIGEICLRVRSNPHYPLGYWEKPEDTERVFGKEWFRTGDVAHKDEDDYFWYEGRGDDVIISAGYRIGPFEVESALIEHPAVAESAAIASPDPERGNIVKAFIRLSSQYKPSEKLQLELQEHVKKRLAAYAYPREIEFVEELPTTLTGKIKRGELRKIEIERKKKKEV